MELIHNNAFAFIMITKKTCFGQVLLIMACIFSHCQKWSISQDRITIAKSLLSMTSFSTRRKTSGCQSAIVFSKNNKLFTTISEGKYQDKYIRLIEDKYSYLLDKNGSFEKYKKFINEGIYKYSNPYLSNGRITTRRKRV